jgi:hypothetical protein
MPVVSGKPASAMNRWLKSESFHWSPHLPEISDYNAMDRIGFSKGGHQDLQI